MRRCLLPLILGIVFIPLSALSQFQQESAFEQHLKALTQHNGDIVYSAIYSLPESQHAFIEIAGDEGWNSYLPDDLPNHIDLNQKTAILRKVAQSFSTQSPHVQRQYLHRIDNWILSEQQLKLFERLTSIEQTMAVLYQQPKMKKFFEPYIKSRNLKETDITPEMVASTLSSSEIAEITFRTLNELSLLHQNELLSTFSSFYHDLHDDLKNW